MQPSSPTTSNQKSTSSTLEYGVPPDSDTVRAGTAVGAGHAVAPRHYNTYEPFRVTVSYKHEDTELRGKIIPARHKVNDLPLENGKRFDPVEYKVLTEDGNKIGTPNELVKACGYERNTEWRKVITVEKVRDERDEDVLPEGMLPCKFNKAMMFIRDKGYCNHLRVGTRVEVFFEPNDDNVPDRGIPEPTWYTGTVVEHEGPTSYGIEFGYVIIEYDHETTADGEIKPGGTARLFPRLHRMRILEPANPPTAPAAAQAAMPVTPAQQKGPYPRTMRGRKQRSQASTLHDADGNFLFPPENAAVVPDPSSGNDGANVDNNGGGACVGGSGGSGGGELAKKGGTGRGNTQCPDCGNTVASRWLQKHQKEDCSGRPAAPKANANNNEHTQHPAGVTAVTPNSTMGPPPPKPPLPPKGNKMTVKINRESDQRYQPGSSKHVNNKNGEHASPDNASATVNEAEASVADTIMWPQHGPNDDDRRPGAGDRANNNDVRAELAQAEKRIKELEQYEQKYGDLKRKYDNLEENFSNVKEQNAMLVTKCAVAEGRLEQCKEQCKEQIDELKKEKEAIMKDATAKMVELEVINRARSQSTSQQNGMYPRDADNAPGAAPGAHEIMMSESHGEVPVDRAVRHNNNKKQRKSAK